MTTPATKRIHGAWYALVALPGLIAIWVLATNIPKLVRGFAEIRVPSYERGAHEVNLKAGTNTIYVEADAEGQPIGTVSCSVHDAAGTPLSLTKLAGHESYSAGGFTGVGVLDVEIPSDGSYVVDCTLGEPVRFAISRGFPFMSIVWSLLALFLALPLTGVTGYLVHRVRNGPRKGARIT